MRITKEITKEEAKELIREIRFDVAKRFVLNPFSLLTNFMDDSIPIDGEIAELEEVQTGMGTNNIWAVLKIDGLNFYLRTAWSDFEYIIYPSESNTVIIEYNGAWNGLGRQNVLPEPLATFNWSGARIETSLIDGPITWDEYKKARIKEGI